MESMTVRVEPWIRVEPQQVGWWKWKLADILRQLYAEGRTCISFERLLALTGRFPGPAESSSIFRKIRTAITLYCTKYPGLNPSCPLPVISHGSSGLFEAFRRLLALSIRRKDEQSQVKTSRSCPR